VVAPWQSGKRASSTRRGAGGHGFLDYLYVSVTNVMAFSPTDTMPMARWAKMMTVQAMVALSTAGLVIARAVNVLG
jgi:hypothetical protein